MKRWSKKGRPRKLSDEQADEIRRLVALRRELRVILRGLTAEAIGPRYGVSAALVRDLAGGLEYKQAWRGP